MRIVVSVLLVAALIGTQCTLSWSAAPKSAPAPILQETLNWIVASWEGEGVQGGSAFTSYLDVTPLLDGTVLQINRASSSGLKEMMLLGYDGSSKKYVGVLYDSRNQIGLFSCELKEKSLDFSQIGLPQGYVSRRTFQLMPDGGILFAIERAEPGQAPAKSVEITFKKK